MIRIDGLRAGYDRHEKLHGLTTDIPAGRLTALVGPNGCGKTTLLRCIAGLMRPVSGEIWLDDARLSAFSDRERARRIAYMPQNRSVPEITVRQLAAHGRYPHLRWGGSLSEKDEEIIRLAMDRTGTAQHADRPLTELSGGERQNAYLAMMLAQQADIMLLDEPTTYLDLNAQFRLMRLLRGLSGEGKTVAAVLHDLPLAMEYADHVLLMQEGKVVASGTPEQVCDSGALDSVFGVETLRTADGGVRFIEIRKPV